MSNVSSMRRLQHELQQLSDNKLENGYQLSIVDDDLYHWRGRIIGPVDTPYQGYCFELDFVLPTNYPFSPPIVKMVTPIQHVNINQSGDICLDILKPSEWKPVLGMAKIAMSIVLLLSEPNPDDPLNSDLAVLYRSNINKYLQHIRDACRKHAIPL